MLLLLLFAGMCIIATNGDVVQKQILYNEYPNDLEYFNAFRTREDSWRALTFPLYANNTEFTVCTLPRPVLSPLNAHSSFQLTPTLKY